MDKELTEKSQRWLQTTTSARKLKTDPDLWDLVRVYGFLDTSDAQDVEALCLNAQKAAIELIEARRLLKKYRKQLGIDQ